jgi:hypothetical protein
LWGHGWSPLADQGIDRGGGQDVLGCHRAGTEHTGPSLRPGGDDTQVLGGQGQRTAVHDLANSGEQVLPGLGDDTVRTIRDLLRETGVSVFPGILTFAMSGGAVRVTSARPWDQLSAAISRIGSYQAVPVG